MNPQIVSGLIRHLLQLAAGALASRGVIGQNDVETVVGALLALGTVVWFAVDRRRAAK